MLGSVALPLAAALAGTGVYVDRYRLIAAFDHVLDASGQLATDDQRARVAALNHQGVVARGVAIAAGTAAGVLLRSVRLRLSMAALRTIDKNGIETVLADLRARGEKV